MIACLMATVMNYILSTMCSTLSEHLRVMAVGLLVIGGLMAFRFLSIFTQKEKMQREEETGQEKELGIDAKGIGLSSMTEKQGNIDLEGGLGIGASALIAGSKNDAGTSGEKRALGEDEDA